MMIAPKFFHSVSPFTLGILSPILSIGSLSAVELLSEDFNSSNGGFTQEALGNTPIDSLYNSVAGTWSMEGDETGPATNYITSPPIPVTNAAGVLVSFNHRYSIESEWDGTALQYSIDGRPFKTVPLASFTQNGYTFGPLIGNHVLGGQDGFNGDSPGYDARTFITSIANIGGVPAGSNLVIRFLGAWDEGARGNSIPGWEIDSLLVETLPDEDGDGMPDEYEDANGLNRSVNDSADDNDSDLASNLTEYLWGSDPQKNDTDEDGLLDGMETGTGIFVDASNRGTNPLSKDTDGDLLEDAVETGDGVFVDATKTGTNPNLADTDDDGFTDFQEVTAGTDPNNSAKKPPLPAPLGFWTFNDQGATSTADHSPNGNDGQVVGSPTYVAGHSGIPIDFALNFDGLDDAVTTPVSLSLLESFTLSGWIKASGISANRAGLFGQNDVVEFGFISGTTIQLYTAPGGAIETILAPTEWTHVAVVSDPSGRRIYVNGVEVSSGGAASPLGASGFTFNIGGGGIYDGSGNYFTGQIDDVAVWGVPLGTRSIQDLASGKINPATIPSGYFGIASFEKTSETNFTFIIEGTIPNGNYIIEQSGNLVDWTESTDFIGTAGSTTTSVSFSIIPPTPAKVFYRARRVE